MRMACVLASASVHSADNYTTLGARATPENTSTQRPSPQYDSMAQNAAVQQAIQGALLQSLQVAEEKIDNELGM